MTYSFPCQDLSIAGKRKGMSKGDNTRSGLLWEVERLLDECKELPQILLMENVPDVIRPANIKEFRKWHYKLEQLGYSNYVDVLNAEDYGIPQNRNRCFMVSILGEYNYIFPCKQKLKTKLKDLQEQNVDEKYYLSEKMIKNIMIPAKEKWQSGKMEIDLDIARPITATVHKMHRADTDNYISVIGNTNPSGRGINGNIYDSNHICPTITTNKGEGIKIKEATKKGYDEANIGDSINLEQPNSKTRRGRIGKQSAQTLTTSCNQAVVIPVLTPDRVNKRQNGRRFKTDGEEMFTITTQDRHGIYDGRRIRKLTPKECWRLMGFDDKDTDKCIEIGISNSQLYKQAGNSIVVNVLEEIFKNLFEEVL